MSKKKSAPRPKDDAESVSQSDGTAAQDPRGETQAQPNPKNVENAVTPASADRSEQQINPSAPTESTEGGHVTEHLVGSGPSTMDSFGEVGHPSGKGTLEIDEQEVTKRHDRKAEDDAA